MLAVAKKGKHQGFSSSGNIPFDCQGAFDMGKATGSIPVLGTI